MVRNSEFKDYARLKDSSLPLFVDDMRILSSVGQFDDDLIPLICSNKGVTREFGQTGPVRLRQRGRHLACW